MSIHKEHEIHGRRKGRNMGVALLLGGFVVIVFAVTVVKLSQPQNVDPSAPNFTPVVADQ